MTRPDVRDPALYRAEIERFWLVRDAAELAVRQGHTLVRWLRRGDESVTFCPECAARAYLRTTAPIVRDGEAFERFCRRH